MPSKSDQKGRAKSQPGRSREAEEEDEMQYGVRSAPISTDEELDETYLNRPRNHSKTLVFSRLYLDLFNPLNENKTRRGGPAGRAIGPGGARASKLSPHEQRRAVIQRFIARWRAEVGDDFYPALRLILPDKDRDRGVYGLKENTIGKLLVKLMQISADSDDGRSLLRWKVPGQTLASRMAGDFAGRCFEVLSKRQMRAEPGEMRIARVNELLDRLAAASGEAEQLPVFRIFYESMNAEELKWLIRIVLRQMKVGATERTFLDLWHPDGEALFGVSSSLRRVCWELYDPAVRLPQEETGVVALMQCFQPQLAQFQMPASFERMVELLRPRPRPRNKPHNSPRPHPRRAPASDGAGKKDDEGSDNGNEEVGPNGDDAEFWIEEKLDGERMQMHMAEDEGIPGGRRFRFWSRKGKDYTYLYGSGFEDDRSALTRHLKTAFDPGVRSIILDGEMVTWDPRIDKMVPFGTLKTAALLGQKAAADDESSERPLFRVFDILYLNGEPLTSYTLRDRRRALERAVPGARRRLEVHPHEVATSAAAIEPLLRRVIAESSEGLVLKNPRSAYRLNSRNDDWLKVKPEYMSEFGESLDCVIIGGYFGSGHRGGRISSFLCGLRMGENKLASGQPAERCISFFKVGGGFRAEDYAQIRHLTEGKWHDWDPTKPPSDYIELGGGERLQYERPDVWIRPSDSVVVSVKAASVGPSDQFATGVTLRFPRFRRLRTDRTWDSALDEDGFARLREGVEQHARERSEMKIEDRKRRPTKRPKRELVIAGQEDADQPRLVAGAGAGGWGGAGGTVFRGQEFCVLSESLKPTKRTKVQLEDLIKGHGGRISQKADPSSGMFLVADKKVVKVASLIKQGGDDVNIVRPRWILDCVSQGGGESLLPVEEAHLLHAADPARRLAAQNVDKFGDSYARDVETEELRHILSGMSTSGDGKFDGAAFLDELEGRGHALGQGGTKGSVFRRCVVYCAREAGGNGAVDNHVYRIQNLVRFGGGSVVADRSSPSITHLVVVAQDAKGLAELAADMRHLASSRSRPPRIVTHKWIEESWREVTLLDEEGFVPP